ncbi:hypothetical protein JJ691_75050 [Kutzneria sp. CA-103260]|nr:hypothetical protein JJ691_75050 [Kutzneria sp. CA-103260]
MPLLLVLALGLVGCGAGPAQAESDAIDKATSGARDAAARVRESLGTQLRTQAFADTLKSLPVGFKSGAVTVLDSSQDPAGSFVARVSIVWDGESNGGFYEQAAVRLCVKYSGVTGPNDRVDMVDADCLGGLPAYVNNVQVARTVTLGK